MSEKLSEKNAPDAGQERSPGPERKTAAAADGSEVIFSDHIKILPGQPLEEYAMEAGVGAFRAKGTGKVAGDMIALICDPGLVPRKKDVTVYSGFTNAYSAYLITSGVVYWPPAKQERYVFIYKGNLGRRIMAENAVPALGWKQDRVVSCVVQPVVSALQEFFDRGFVHGSIRPSNMYDGGASDNDIKILLGDCLSLPHSYAQPVIYETIPRGMASPLGRGVGTMSDDLYALGVSVAVLMRSSDPMEGMSAEEIIKQKVELGSYAAITGKDRFKGSVLELLRGLLSDDSTQRWTLEEVQTWLGGNRVNPRQAGRQQKAPRAFPFNEERYSYASLLAMDLHKNPSEATKLIENNELQQWVTRSLEDEEMLARVEKAVRESLQGGKNHDYPEILASTLSNALDKYAPVRYLDMSFMAEAFGPMLAHAIHAGEEIKPFVNLITKSLVMHWTTMHEDPAVDINILMSRFDVCRNFMRQNKVGYGIERCLYMLAPDVHCLSEKLKGYIVHTPEEMVQAFESICQNGHKPRLFLDRHSIAFLAVRDPRTIEPALYDLDNAEEHRRVIGNLACFAQIQKRSNIGPQKALAQVFMKKMPLILEHFHDRELRERLEKEVTKHASEGSLVKMAELVANPDTVNMDLRAFREAMQEYQNLEKQRDLLETSLQDRKKFARGAAGNVAAAASMILSVVIILCVAYMYISGFSGF